MAQQPTRATSAQFESLGCSYWRSWLPPLRRADRDHAGLRLKPSAQPPLRDEEDFIGEIEIAETTARPPSPPRRRKRLA